MTEAWPWLAVAGAGALHGLNPATGWLLAATRGLRTRDAAQALQAVAPLALGHLASVAGVAGAVALGLGAGRVLLEAGAGALLLAVLVLRVASRRHPAAVRAPASHAGLALWSFIVSTAHGAGLMLVPALLPMCLGAGTGRMFDVSRSLVLALAAVAVHAAAMLAVTGLLALAACRGVDLGRRLLRRGR